MGARRPRSQLLGLRSQERPSVVRELTQKREWLAGALISATADEVRRLITRARDGPALGKPAEFHGVPHRYCQSHFLRDIAEPMAEIDSHAKVQMRRKMRGLRTIERAMFKRRGIAARGAPPEMSGPGGAAGDDAKGTVAVTAGAVVLDYCAAVSGILNEDQGKPLRPPGLRMAETLDKVRESIRRNLDEKKGGVRRGPTRPTGRRLHRPRPRRSPGRKTIRGYVADIADIAAILDPQAGSCEDRQEDFGELIDRFERGEDPIRRKMAGVMVSFLAGLFVGEGNSRRSGTISIWNDGSARPRVMSGGSTATVTRGCGSYRKGRRWCPPWVHMSRTRGHSARPT